MYIKTLGYFTMKIRNSFVSNSSSASFLINKNDITKEQVDYIKRHREVSNMANPPYIVDIQDLENYKDYFYRLFLLKQFDYELKCENGDEWDIDEDKEYIKGETYMDNFNMFLFLKLIGVKKAELGGSNYCQKIGICDLEK